MKLKTSPATVRRIVTATLLAATTAAAIGVSGSAATAATATDDSYSIFLTPQEAQNIVVDSREALLVCATTEVHSGFDALGLEINSCVTGVIACAAYVTEGIKGLKTEFRLGADGLTTSRCYWIT